MKHDKASAKHGLRTQLLIDVSIKAAVTLQNRRSKRYTQKKKLRMMNTTKIGHIYTQQQSQLNAIKATAMNQNFGPVLSTKIQLAQPAARS